MTKYRIVARRSGDPVIGYSWFARVQRWRWWWGWESIPNSVVWRTTLVDAAEDCAARFEAQHGIQFAEVDFRDITVLG
jgi:hypothetical protein